jgi:ABC-2 type transport system ATP-binding protein
MDSVIEVEGLRKEYRKRRGRTVAVDGLDLAVPAGGVYGFLGPNGSGKTTTIRCLLGLATATGGRLELLGAPSPRNLGQVMSRVGSIVETPAHYPNFSARRNLWLLGQMDGIPRRRVDEVLERVGLADRADDAVKGYSLGMRQRLGLAATLLKDPELLILDEPANGLDPAGIREIRELLRSLGDEGRTVFVSSHILAEVQQTCDRVAILSRGRCVVDGPVADVLSHGRKGGIIVRLADVEAGQTTLLAAGLEVERRPDHLRVTIDPGDGARVSELLGRDGLWPVELRPDEITLEEVFLDLTGEAGE